VNSLTDQQLLRDYTERRSEAAFAELVRRHVDLVYSAALRMVRDAHLAEDVAQGAFVALAQNARQLVDRPVLSGWLHRTTQNLAANIVRSDVRRRAREQEAAAMNELFSTESDAIWEHIAPHLDHALGELSEPDRDVVLLRYFQRKSAREIAQTLGVSEEAAQKRVNRAVERLREFFAKHGVTVGASGLVVVISANAVQAAPIGLALTISAAAALGSATIATTATATVIKTIAMTTLQKSIIAGTLAAAVSTGVYQAHQASTLRQQVQTLQQQQAPLAEQIEQLSRERDEAARQLASSARDSEQAAKDNIELLRLRNLVSQLRQQAGAPKVGQPNVAPPTLAPPQAPIADIGRELGMGILSGDPAAFEKLVELAKAQHQSFKTNTVGLNDTQRGELSARTFATLRSAFEVLGEAAVQNHPMALDAVARAILIPELKGLAVQTAGKLAGAGSEGALELLLNPQNYGILLSSSVSALRPAAEVGNQRAIDALSAVTKDDRNRALWVMAADGLAKAAASGNPVATDALIGLIPSTNQSVRNTAVLNLKRAAANQNSRAAEALAAMGVK